MNVYSNKPIDDLNKVVLKKKSVLELKEIEKEFYRQCKERDQKIEKIQFSLNSSLLVWGFFHIVAPLLILNMDYMSVPCFFLKIKLNFYLYSRCFLKFYLYNSL